MDDTKKVGIIIYLCYLLRTRWFGPRRIACDPSYACWPAAATLRQITPEVGFGEEGAKPRTPTTRAKLAAKST